ncbi:class I SAM-dependent methyltransferase [Nocardioides sp. Kera G14]|uniref:class I SAM-dependent methyltransferase n=1 Tax=Nocardioides sp. Kera G14 TaxID=2884264 RepID=UPI001D11D370|nr:class I SAM-dependent methyltransferase [Nocardioides sp. Kera G14]UDY22678.1 class I SAM-dependent methyltransferase [Nocardioides sp. Kera G14]
MSTSGHSPLSLAKQAYAHSMKAIGRGMVKTGVAAETVPPISDRWAHWRHSLTKVYDSVAMAKLDVPWWTYDAIQSVDGWLAARKRPIRVFEYGSGASTIWLSRRADQIHSVEHHRGFGEMMTAEVSSLGNVTLRIVEPVASDKPVVGSEKEGHAGQDFADYVASIDEVPGEFDLIVIDGRAREACLAHSAVRLADGGLIVFDNSRRTRYRRAIAASGLREERFRGLTPTLPYPDQTSVLTRR